MKCHMAHFNICPVAYSFVYNFSFLEAAHHMIFSPSLALSLLFMELVCKGMNVNEFLSKTKLPLAQGMMIL